MATPGVDKEDEGDVDLGGIEPPISSMRMRRITTVPQARCAITLSEVEVDPRGIEPLIFSMPWRRRTGRPRARKT